MNTWAVLGIAIAAFILGMIVGRATARNKQSSEPFVNLNMAPLEGNSVQDLLQAGRKIEAIKRYRQENGVGLKEAKDAVDRMAMGMPLSNRFDDFGLDDGHPADGDEMQDSFGGSGNYASSTLDDEIQDLLRKGNKINAIKRYREVRGVGLKEAKDVVDRMEAEMR
jgi:ribosomal protein L7/L12